MEHVERVVRSFLSDHVMSEEEARRLEGDDDLLEHGVLNSLTLVHLVESLEKTFGFELPPAEFQADNFRSIDRICRFVADKRRG